MVDPTPSDVTLLLRRAREDRGSALRELLPMVHDELRRIAGAQMRRERSEHTLAPTALVHEAYMRLADQAAVDWQDRAHFLAIAANAMRQVLVDHARRRNALKRGGDRAQLTLSEDLAESERGAVDVLDLNEHLDALRARHERRAEVVVLRFYGGLTFEEVAHVLDVSVKTAQADWYFARAWLRRAMSSDHEGPPS